MKRTEEKTNYEIWRDELLSDPELKEYYDSIDVEAEMLAEMAKERNKNHLTQQDLSKLTGIDRADISKLENGNTNPTLKTLMKVAKALKCRLDIRFVPLSKK